MLNTWIFRLDAHIYGICAWISMMKISNNYSKILVYENSLLDRIGKGVETLFSFKVVHLTLKHPVLYLSEYRVRIYSWRFFGVGTFMTKLGLILLKLFWTARKIAVGKQSHISSHTILYHITNHITLLPYSLRPHHYHTLLDSTTTIPS